jgi:DNA-binding NarL/FixJ family response regulator
MGNYNIVVADDHALLRKGIIRILEEVDYIHVVGEAGDGLELIELLKKKKADMAIIDISMPNLRGIEATKEIKKIYPSIKVIILTMHKKVEYLQQALTMGADGYLLKEDTDEELLSAIENVKRGKIYISQALSEEVNEELVKRHRFGQKKITSETLTTREREILKLIAEGKSNRDIAQLLFISTRTVENHRAHIMQKLGFKKVTELVTQLSQFLDIL